jgi:hypothetical protein
MKAKKVLSPFHIFGCMLEPNKSDDFLKTFVKIWLLENQKNTYF